ncbi:MAG: hypothetical protein FJX67_04440 [Alphaproteobacteria bacterium]|nr:hypothetical protein [Alphaproteobacteria bacterium]
MRDRPTAAELLAIARTTLLDAIVPALPETARYEARMVAAAIAIALREAAAGGAAAEAERDGLAALYGEAVDASETTETALLRLNRRLAADIRAGAFERDGHAAVRVRAILAAATAAKLTECNPGYAR